MKVPHRPDLGRTWAIVPLRGLETAKTRLGGQLDAEERLELVVAMAEQTLAATRDARHVAGTVLVTADPAAGELAERFGARPLVQRIAGLNGAIVEARAVAVAAGATAVVVLPIDLARVTSAAIDAAIEAADRAPVGRPVVVLIPDRHGSGTNLLAIAPADAIEPAFGIDSRALHRAAAATAGATYLELGGPLTLDVDTADDLLTAQRIAAEAGIPEGP
jgi:2-phospho-L-lactate guanylyltransferase